MYVYIYKVLGVRLKFGTINFLSEMGSVWFLCIIYFLLHANRVTSSTHVFQENKSENQSSNIHLNLYRSEKSLIEDLLFHDQNRVESLQSMVSNQQKQIRRDIKPASSSSSSPASTMSVHIPLNPGLSIGSGNYYVKVGLGSPTKYYPMLMDTGSSLSWLQCQPCKVYCHSQVGPVFDPAASSTYAIVPCASAECTATKRATLNDPFCTADKSCVYTASYGDSSFSVGYLSRDRLSLSPSQVIPSFIYGCGQDNQGLYGLSAGLLGLGRDKLSLLSQASTQFGYGFSYCLPSGSKPGGGGGFLSVGNSALGTPGSYKFTPLVTDSRNPSLYFLNFVGISVGQKQLALAVATKTIIDSGTVITRLPRPLYTSLKAAFASAVAGKLAPAPAFSILDACFKSGMEVAARAVPQMLIKFGGGVELNLAADNILIEADKGIVCLAFAATDGIAIVGNTQQQRYNVAYDVANSRVGFAPGGCS